MYCIECGNKLIEKYLDKEGIIPFCTRCNEFRFPLYNVAVSMIVINKETSKILLIKQYGKDRNILVAGYVSKGEALEDAVKREIKEETNMTVSSIKYNRSEYFAPSNTLMCNYTVLVDNDKELKVNEEIDSYNWYLKEDARKQIMPNSLASKFLNAYLDEE